MHCHLKQFWTYQIRIYIVSQFLRWVSATGCNSWLNSQDIAETWDSQHLERPKMSLKIWQVQRRLRTFCCPEDMSRTFATKGVSMCLIRHFWIWILQVVDRCFWIQCRPTTDPEKQFILYSSFFTTYVGPCTEEHCCLVTVSHLSVMRGKYPWEWPNSLGLHSNWEG